MQLQYVSLQLLVNKWARSEKKSLLFFFRLSHLSAAVLDRDFCDVTKGTNFFSRRVLLSQLDISYILKHVAAPTKSEEANSCFEESKGKTQTLLSGAG